MTLDVLIPRTRRAIDGPAADGPDSPSASLTDQQIRALIADSAAEVIFHTGGLWGHVLTAVDTDGYGAPSNWEITPDLPFDQQTVLIAQAALSYFFHEFKDKKVQETISNPARSWTYSLSANLLLEQMKYLRQMRDDALARVSSLMSSNVAFFSFIAVRDSLTSAAVEPWVDYGALSSGQEVDWRF